MKRNRKRFFYYFFKKIKKHPLLPFTFLLGLEFLGHDPLRLHRRSDVISLLLPRRQNDGPLFGGHDFVLDLREQVTDAVELSGFFVVRGDDVPGGVVGVGVLWRFLKSKR